jgi:hypothetical protein
MEMVAFLAKGKSNLGRCANIEPSVGHRSRILRHIKGKHSNGLLRNSCAEASLSFWDTSSQHNRSSEYGGCCKCISKWSNKPQELWTKATNARRRTSAEAKSPFNKNNNDYYNQWLYYLYF